MKDEKWFGHAAHFICGRDCQFHLATLVNGYLVSTVGEYWPDRLVREIHAESHDRGWLAENRHLRGDVFDAAYMTRFGYERIGWDRTYETMVFEAGQPCLGVCNCGLPSINGSELDFAGYNDAGAATEGHMAMVAKYRRVEKAKKARKP